MTGENRVAAATAEASLGSDALKAADALLALGLYNDAVSRAYYAAFHYARALLVSEGLQPKTHRGVIALLAEHFEKTGRLAPAVLSALARLQTFRGLADYDSSDRVDPSRAQSEVESARHFVTAAKALLSAISA